MKTVQLLRCLLAPPCGVGGLRLDRRSSAPRIWTVLIGLCLVVAVPLGSARVAHGQGDVEAGKRLYEWRCALCHGVAGDGKGPGAELLAPKPRDFTTGTYKIRTSEGNVPTDQDIFRIITEGMPGTSMPGWRMLSERDRWNLVAYLKTFAPDAFSNPPKPIELPRDVASSAESIARGKEMYEAIECFKCHGETGRADGESRDELTDSWGEFVPPANLTKRWTFRGGARRVDIATRIAAGVAGTPMPAFLDAVEVPEDVWHLTNYILTLGPASPRYATLVTVTAVDGEIPDDPAAEFWTAIEPSNIPMMGQVIVDPRNFNPSIDLVAVRAAYNDREIVFHLTWDDPTESKGDGTKTFPDAISLQFPPRIARGTERPYFLMGDDVEAVYLLRWEQGAGVSEVTAHGPTNQTPIEGSEATGQAVWEHGQYRLVMRRALASDSEGRPTFEPRVFTPVAFQAWDGGAGETGTKMSLTSWYYLRLEEPQSNRRFVVPPVVAVLTFVAMVGVVRAANRRR
jgi:DMSO reductase family type II enzyme heme b subunit